MASSSISSSRRRFFAKLTAFLLLLLVLDLGIGHGLRIAYFRQKSGLGYRTTYAVQQSRDEVLILGSSRAQANYVPAIMEQELEQTCYNAGRDGQSVLFASAVFSAVAARDNPTVVVLDLIPADFYKYHGHYDRLAALLPYYRSNEAVRPAVRLRSPLERIKLLSNIYPFNSLPLQILRYNMVDRKVDRGHVPQHGEIRLPLPPPQERAWISNGLDPNMFAFLDSVITSCQKNGIHLYLLISPIYDGWVSGREALAEIETLLEDTPFEIWDLSEHPDLVGNPQYFRDRGHLNNVGAAKYTGIVADMIRADLDSAVSLAAPGEAAD